ncbi:MAG: allantoate amidohydrolase [Xanthobacteraceae bacterium]|nr:allantoate amidohydrolase [Xanthobacteraceae bacterium]
MTFGQRIVDLAARLAQWSETSDGLTCTYLTPPHRAVAAELKKWMHDAGMSADIDAVGNVVGRYRSDNPSARTLILGSHYDTVRNAGHYDGRLGILTALVAVEHLHQSGRKLPFNVDVIAFSEEEGVRFSTPYIGSSAMAGQFDTSVLDRSDGEGHRLGDVMRAAGFDPKLIPTLARRPQDLIGYLEVHIEQGPVLLHEDFPVGIVTSIAGSVRQRVSIAGTAGHAGTVPMALRHDAAAAAAEIVLYVERRCAAAPTLVGTVGELRVPGGAINVIPGHCELTIDIRAGDDQTRDAAASDVLAEIKRVAERRGVKVETKEVSRSNNVSCSPRIQRLLAAAIARAGIGVRPLPSGAGHDAMQFKGITELGMLFVRCGNGGISHSPLETVAAADADLAARILLDTIANYEQSA